MTYKYFSFLLRIWQLENQDQEEWFASLEDPNSHEVIYFKDMENMFTKLRQLRANPQNIEPD